jgi:hypothetical protein
VEGTGAASSQTQLSGGRRAAQTTPSFADRPGAPGFLPELVDVVGAAPLSRVGGDLRTSYHAKGAAWQMSWGGRGVDYVMWLHGAQVAQQPGYGGYLGVEAAMSGDGCQRKFQHALTVELR